MIANNIMNNNQDTPAVNSIVEQTTDTTTMSPVAEVKQQERLYSSPIYHPTYTPELNKNIPGSTVERGDKNLSLYDKNLGYLNILTNNIDATNIKIATTAFQANSTLPKINGKVIELGEFSTAWKNPASRKIIMDQAAAITNYPNIDGDTQLNLLDFNMDAIDMMGQLAGQSKKFWKSLYEQSISTDAKNNTNWSLQHQSMFKEDLSGFTTPEEYVVNLTNIKNGQYNLQVDKSKIAEFKKNPDSWFPPIPKTDIVKIDKSYINQISTFLNKEGYKENSPVAQYILNGVVTLSTDDAATLKALGIEPNSDKGKQLLNATQKNNLKQESDRLFRKYKSDVLRVGSTRDPNKGYTAVNLPEAHYNYNIGNEERYREASTTDHWNEIISRYKYKPYYNQKTIKNSPDYEENFKSYEVSKANIIADYNKFDSRHAFDIRADLQQKFIKNKGGEKESTAGTINFDNNSPEMWYKGQRIRTPEHTDFLNLNDVVQAQLGLNPTSTVYDRKIKIKFGKVSGENPDDISTIDPQIKDFFALLDEDIHKGHKLNSELHPKGTITFTSAAGNSNKYQAYNIKFNPTYLKHQKFEGAEKKGILKLHPELLTEGVTIYIPKEYSQKITMLSRNNKEATDISTTEGLFTLNNVISYTYPGAGNLNLQNDKDSNQVVVSGWFGRFNPENGKVDTVKMGVQRYPFNQMLVLDTLVGNWKNKVKINFKYNHDAKLEYNKLNGAIYDPNQLKNK